MIYCTKRLTTSVPHKLADVYCREPCLPLSAPLNPLHRPARDQPGPRRGLGQVPPGHEEINYIYVYTQEVDFVFLSTCE